MSKTKFVLCILGLWVFVSLAAIGIVNYFISTREAEAYTIAATYSYGGVSPRQYTWNAILWSDKPHDATAVDTVAADISFANPSTLTLWLKADENTGTVDIKVEYEFFVGNAGWGGEAGVPQQLFANMITNEWEWERLYNAGVADKVPATADSIRFIVTGNAGNGADIDLYLTLSGSW